MNANAWLKWKAKKENLITTTRQIDNLDIKSFKKKYFQLKVWYTSIIERGDRMKAKEIMGVAIFTAIIMAIILFGANRMEKIEKGEMVLVNQSEMK